jgi:hypothetical protein
MLVDCQKFAFSLWALRQASMMPTVRAHSTSLPHPVRVMPEAGCEPTLRGSP